MGGRNTIQEKPFVGVVGFDTIPTVGGGGTLANGLNVGDPFKIPTQFMSQMRGVQVAIVLNAAVVQLDTDFTLAMPAAGRNPQGNKKAVPGSPETPNGLAVTPVVAAPLTRQFSAGNWSAVGNGQNNGLIGAAAASRLMANSVVTTDIGQETMTLTYRAGPNQFGGTMGSLVDGIGRLYIVGAFLGEGDFPEIAPFAATNPLGGDPATEPNGLRERNGVGWDYTITGNQRPGRIKALQDIGPVCAVTPPPSPVGCNEVNDFDTNGFTIAFFGAATSTKHVFAWTTGTVTVHVTAVRPPNVFINTLTGMGYDTIGLTAMGVNLQRNVGLVAGSYTVRTSIDTPETNINIEMIGINLRFAPEPQPTLALLCGLVLLGVLGARRR